MGYSKKLYNVLGGVTHNIISWEPYFYQSHFSQTLQKQFAVFVYFSQESFVTFYQISGCVFYQS